MSDEVYWKVDLEKELLSVSFYGSWMLCLACKCEDSQGWRIHSATDPRCNPFLLSNLACFFLQKTEVKGSTKEAMQENEMLLSLVSAGSCMVFYCCYSALAHYTCSLSYRLQKAFLWHPVFITSTSYHVQSKATCNKKLGKEFGLWKPGLCLYLLRDLCCIHGQTSHFISSFIKWM